MNTNDGDTQYLRESGIAFLLHAAALQATERSGTPDDEPDLMNKNMADAKTAPPAVSEFSISMPKSVRASRTLFTKLVSPEGRLELSVSVLEAIVREATKIHPALLLRFIAGTRWGTQAVAPGRPFNLAVRGANEALVRLLEPAALISVARDADSLDWQRSLTTPGAQLVDTGNAYYHATMDVARGVRAISQIALKDIPALPTSPTNPAPAAGAAPPVTSGPSAPVQTFNAQSPAGSTPSLASNPSPGQAASAVEERVVHVHLDAFVQLRPSVADGASSEMVMMLRDFAVQLEWLLYQLDLRQEGVSPRGDPAVNFNIGEVSFHLHAMLPPAREFSSNQLAVLQRCLESAIEADVALSRVASLASGSIAEAVEVAATAPRPGMDPNTFRLVAIVAAEPQQFHAAQLGQAIAAAISDHAATATVVNAWALSTATTGAAPATTPSGTSGLNTSSTMDKPQPKKGVKAAAPQSSASAVTSDKPLNQSSDAPADRPGTAAYVCLRRSKHVSSCKDVVSVNDVVAPWVRPFFASFSVPASPFAAGPAPLSSNDSFASTSPKSAATDLTSGASGTSVECLVDAAECPALVLPLAACVTAEGTARRGVLADPATLVTAFDCLAEFPSEGDKHRQPAIYDPCVLTALALQVSRLYRCAAKPFVVTVGTDKVPHALSGAAAARCFESVRWFAGLAHQLAANAPFKKTVQPQTSEYLANPVLPPTWAAMVRKAA